MIGAEARGCKAGAADIQRKLDMTACRDERRPLILRKPLGDTMSAKNNTGMFR